MLEQIKYLKKKLHKHEYDCKHFKMRYLNKEMWNEEILSKRAMIRTDILRLTQEVNELVKQ